MKEEFSIVEARNRLSSLVHQAEKGATVRLTRHGKPIAVLISIRDYEGLLRVRPAFWSAVTAFRERMSEAGIEITDGDFEDLRDTSPGREDAW